MQLMVHILTPTFSLLFFQLIVLLLAKSTICRHREVRPMMVPQLSLLPQPKLEIQSHLG